MAGKRKKNPKSYEERLEHDREFRALLEKRKALDAKLAAEKAAGGQQ